MLLLTVDDITKYKYNNTMFFSHSYYIGKFSINNPKHPTFTRSTQLIKVQSIKININLPKFTYMSPFSFVPLSKTSGKNLELYLARRYILSSSNPVIIQGSIKKSNTDLLTIINDKDLTFRSKL